VESITGRAQIHTYVDEARRGDHICYYSDLRKIKLHYPGWDITKPLGETVREIVQTWNARIPA
jgi:CDP-paratose 2-epimerase